MKKKITSFFKTTFTFVLLTITLLIANSQVVTAQMIETGSRGAQFKPLNREVAITGLSGSINWLKLCANCHSSGYADTHLYFELRRIYMLNARLGLGFRGFTNLNIDGFFDNLGFGGSGLGPIIRYYVFTGNRWQPYLQAGFIAGHDIALEGGLTFLTVLKAGTAYKITNNFGIFLEAGPAWEYTPAFNFEEISLLVQIGIEFYEFK